MAKAAEAAERYEDMTAYMNHCVRDKVGNELTVEERNNISVGYKNLMASRRSAFRAVQQTDIDDETLAPAIDEYKNTIVSGLNALINEVKEKVVAKFTEGDKAATDTEVSEPRCIYLEIS